MLFRNRRLARLIACFLLLQTLSSIFVPSVSLAVMGPGQPEFISYEPAGASDMVNMTTGDMTYQIPLLDIPGSEQQFSLPLTYKAGIRLEQEASWVGLGWTLNPGAIARNLNNYPDDASNYAYRTTYSKKLDRGWKGGLPGVIDLGWSSVTGHSGTVDLIGLASVSWENSKFKSADLVGIKYTKGAGVEVDPVRMAFAALTIISAGTAPSGSFVGNLALKQAQSIGIGNAINNGMNLFGKKIKPAEDLTARQ
ncbi:hypothetical protein LRS06_02450 [Hymenobacter sp. J193]|uniref:hypothetical protein n=1 Tax=Hymenobacter sp. J193 TaxID=2898429 RepID=UPI0021507950|nr:hypothetical protein [Hymenobacter sp. J193]MCR5886652.1 hypothetical protein [Hymenobacter sp. J193]